MLRAKPLTVSFFTGLVVLSLSTPAFAQVMAPGMTPLEAVSSGAVRSRAPGNMVTAGVAAALALADAARGGVEITETACPTSIRAQLLADSIAAVFEQLNQLLVGFTNLLLARAGLTTPASPTGGLEDGAPGDTDHTGEGRRSISGIVAPPVYNANRR